MAATANFYLEKNPIIVMMPAEMNLRSQATSFAKILVSSFKSKIVSVVLFGSVGRGDARPDSDIDMIVVIKNLPEGRYGRRKLLEPALNMAEKRGLTASFNCHIKSLDEAKKITVMYFDLPTDAKILFDKDGFFCRIIDQVKDKIKANGSVRKKWGNFYYWELVPHGNADSTFEIL